MLITIEDSTLEELCELAELASYSALQDHLARLETKDTLGRRQAVGWCKEQLTAIELIRKHIQLNRLKTPLQRQESPLEEWEKQLEAIVNHTERTETETEQDVGVRTPAAISEYFYSSEAKKEIRDSHIVTETSGPSHPYDVSCPCFYCTDIRINSKRVEIDRKAKDKEEQLARANSLWNGTPNNEGRGEVSHDEQDRRDMYA